MKTLLVLSLLALCALGSVAVADAAPTCVDLAGQGSVCHEESADTTNGVSVSVSASVVVNGP